MFVVVSRFDRLRAGVEAAIRTVYAERYGARLTSFARTIVAKLNAAGDVECAAGIRFGREALFSECYLDQPIERLLQSRCDRDFQRARIVEVSHLVGTNAGRSTAFVRGLIELLQSQDAEAAIFTATRPLRGLLRRNGIQMLELGRAERRRVDNPDIWGSYFDHDPRIVAVVQHDPFAVTRRIGFSLAAADFSVDARVF
jgi:Thermostable hemolysin